MQRQHPPNAQRHVKMMTKVANMKEQLVTSLLSFSDQRIRDDGGFREIDVGRVQDQHKANFSRLLLMIINSTSRHCYFWVSPPF
jgi:hypothetical protein